VEIEPFLKDADLNFDCCARDAVDCVGDAGCSTGSESASSAAFEASDVVSGVGDGSGASSFLDSVPIFFAFCFFSCST
jgi:hypothetical protein